MCYQLVEFYSTCRCLYYQHAVDRCGAYGRPGHGIQRRTILVGYACSDHTYGASWSNATTRDSRPSEPTRSDGHRLTTAAGGRLNVGPAAATPKANPGIILEVTKSIASAREKKAEVRELNSQDSTSKGDIDFAQPDSDDSDAWWHDSDEESVVSVASSATTINGDTVGLLFSNLLRFGDLRYLWPQLIARSLTWKRSHRTIERLLRRYSDDLRKLALNETDESITKADRALRIQASRFVRRSRVNIARRICEAHYDATEPPSIDSEHEGLERKDGGRPFHDRDSDSDGNDDSLFVFEFAHAFLFRTDPILFLQANVKALVRFRATDTASPWDRIWNRAKLTFENAFLTGKHRPSQLANSTRLHWTCVSLEARNQRAANRSPIGVW